MRYKILLYTLGIFNIFVSFEFVYAVTSNTQSLLATSTTNPSGTFTSGIKILEGYSRMKGLIVINSDVSGTPTARINQAIDEVSAIAGTWHGTNTITFTRSDILWKGEIDFSIFGAYANLTIGNFGTATFNKVNWYASLETAVSTTLSTIITGTVTASKTSVSSATNNSFTIGAGTSTIVLASNTNRKYFLIVNYGTQTDAFYQLASTATKGSGTPLYKSGGNRESDFSEGIYTGAISIIADTNGTTTITTEEY